MANMQDWNQRIIDEFRTNGGTVTTAGFGRSLILVHHVGAKSGTERIAPLRGIPTPSGAWLIAASKAGAPENPGWYHNLLANPDTKIETPDDGVVDVRAVELTGAERDVAWSAFTESSQGFRDYEARTSRVIPVLELRRH